MTHCGLSGFPEDADLLILFGWLAYGVHLILKVKAAGYLIPIYRNVNHGRLRKALNRYGERVMDLFLYFPAFFLPGVWGIYRFGNCEGWLGPLTTAAIVVATAVLTILFARWIPVYRRSR